MNLQTQLNKYTALAKTKDTSNQTPGDGVEQPGRHIPGGLAGRAMTGGIMAVLLGNNSARRFAGTALTCGSAALIGGLAYKAYRNWQESKHYQTRISENSFSSAEVLSADFQQSLLKAMIAAARADGHIDANEQQRIFDVIEGMELSTEMKAHMFDLLHQSITVEELAQAATCMEQKTELYLVSCLMMDPDQPAEKEHLFELARALALPPGLTRKLQLQARQTIAAA